MDEDTLVLKRASNGVTMKSVYTGMDDHPVIAREVIEQSEDCFSDESQQEAEFGRRVCGWILDWLGVYGSKHKNYRLELNVVHQQRED